MSCLNHFIKLSLSNVIMFLFFMFFLITSFAFPLTFTTFDDKNQLIMGETLFSDESFQDGVQVDEIVKLKGNIVAGRRKDTMGFTGRPNMVGFSPGITEDLSEITSSVRMEEDVGSGLDPASDEGIRNETVGHAVTEPRELPYQLTTVTTPRDNEELSSSGDFVESSLMYNEMNPIRDRNELVPLPLRNLPHDIPVNRIISEVLAENILNDKHFDEMRVEELIHELMAQSVGVGEVYSDDFDYDVKRNGIV